MPTLTRLAACAAAAAFALTLGARATKAQDPVVVDPANYKVVYEDDEVRVIEYHDTPGYKGPIHSHERPYVVYVLSNSRRQFNKLDSRGRCVVVDKVVSLTLHQALTPGVPVTHCEMNIGKTDTFLFIVEDKRQQPPPPPARGAPRRGVRRPSSRRAHR